MRVLAINESVKAEIKQVIANAEQHRYDLAMMRKLISGDLPPAGDHARHVTIIPDGYRVVFSIEEQPIGWCRHHSVSVDKKGKYPTPQAVELIMQEFGMGNDIYNSLKVWMEKEGEAINVVTKMET